MRRRRDPLRAVRHALWLGTVLGFVALVILLTADWTSIGDPGETLGPLYFLMIASPVWLPALVGCSGLVGLVTGALLQSRRPAARLAASCAALLLVGAMGALGHYFSPRGICWPATGVAWTLAAGTGTALLAARAGEQTSPRSPGSRRAIWWSLAAMETAVATWIATLVLGFMTVFSSEPGSSCTPAGGKLGTGVAVGRLFPPQTWCVGPATTSTEAPNWTSAALVASLTLAMLSASRIARWSAPDPQRRLIRNRWGCVAVAILVLGALCAALTAGSSPSATARAQARQSAASAASSSSPSKSPPSSSLPPATASAVRDDLTRLRTLAQESNGGSLLWPTPLAITNAACTGEDGRAGSKLTLSGIFTTRDLATARDNEDYNDIVQANIEAAKEIADAWRDSGIIGLPEQLHGQWYAGDSGHRTIDEAHIGFVDSAGQITVGGRCAGA